MLIREILIVTPVYNDWQSLKILAEALAQVAARHELRIRILAVDDGSTLPTPGDLPTNLQLIRLARNLGHQRAISVGLSLVHEMQLGLPVIVMDGDGEDRPEDIPLLLSEHDTHPEQVIFAQRSKRYEGGLFLPFYIAFKFVFHLLTGAKISFGNYCLIPPENLRRIVYMQEIWNNFPAGIMRSGLKWRMVPTERGMRYAGRSKMNLVALVAHGLSAISVFIEVVYVRLLFAAIVLMGLDVLAFGVLVYIQFFTSTPVPDWATSMGIGLMVIMVQAILFLALLSFFVLSYRSAKTFIPAVDYKVFLPDLGS